MEDLLRAHAERIARAAAFDGYVDDRTGARVTLGDDRAAWWRDAEVIRAAAEADKQVRSTTTGAGG